MQPGLPLQELTQIDEDSDAPGKTPYDCILPPPYDFDTPGW